MRKDAELGKSNDADLVGRIRSGDQSAFALLVERYRDVVGGIAFHYLRNLEEAQDAAQETFIHAYLHLDELREAPRFAPWLRRIAANRCLDTLRQRARESLPLSSLDELGEWAEPVAITDGDMTETLCRKLFVRQALGCLSEKVRLTVTLCYLGDYSHAEIAQFLDIPVTTVRSRLRHAKRQLRQETILMTSERIPSSISGPDWTRQVVEEALRRGKEAAARHERGAAITAYDTALAELDTAGAETEAKRLMLTVLRQKQSATLYNAGNRDRLKLLEQALALARELGDTRAEAEVLQDLGRTDKSPEKSPAYYSAALALFRQQGNISKQAECLLYLGAAALFQNDAETGKRCLSEAQPLFQSAQSHDWQAVCTALLEMLSRTASVGLERLLLWVGMCDTLTVNAGKVQFASQPGFQLTRRTDTVPATLFVGALFWQLSALKTILDPSANVGESQSGNVFSFSNQPLRATMTVLRNTDHLSVPAGEFSDCLLIELVTTSPETPSDDAPERLLQLNRTFLCGRRRASYARGVGLVQLEVEQGEGVMACLSLQSYKLATVSNDYLPLAIGNAWTYGRTDISSEYVSEESYRVTARAGDNWYLSHSAFAYENAITPLAK
jgi:RNA polymerase sigma-70 factor (ECF subfamily)